MRAATDPETFPIAEASIRGVQVKRLTANRFVKWLLKTVNSLERLRLTVLGVWKKGYNC